MRTELALATALGERYELHEVVGQGGMATVYRATDRRHGRDVAVKVLRDGEGGARAVDRFRREIETAAKLVHPHILPVHDSGAADALRWYVMPLVRGPSLRARLQAGPIPVPDALRIALQVAEALAYAHARGVVHRDVKPENVLIEEGHAVLADFGVAHLLDEEPATWTRTGHVVGTPAYMSPEQATGDAPVTGATDVYALGCILHELVAGTPPFGTGPHAQVLLAHVSDPVPPLPAREGLPGGVATVVKRCLAKLPGERPTASEVAQALDHLRSASRSGAAIPGMGARVAWTRVVAGGGVIAAAAALAWTVASARDREGTTVTRTAVAAPAAPGWIVLGELEAGGADSALARTVRDLLQSALAESQVARSLSMPQLRQVARDAGWADTVRISAERAVELAKRYGVPAAVTGSIGSLGPAAVSLTLQVLSAADATQLASISERGPRDSLVVLVDRLGRRLRERLDERPEVLRRARPLDHVLTPSLAAFDNYAAGVDASRAGKLAEGTRLLRRAVDVDTAFAAAWLGLATNWITLGLRDSAVYGLAQARRFPERLTIAQRARVEAQAAATLDADLPRALRLYDELVASDSTVIAGRTNRGLLRMHSGDYEGALDDFRTAYLLLAPFVPSLGQVQLIDQAIALASLGRARSIDSLLPFMGERWRPAVVLLSALARHDIVRAGHIADSLAAMGATEPIVAPLIVTSRAASMAQRGSVDSADLLLASAALRAGGARGRWYEQHRLLLHTSGRVPAPRVAPKDTVEPVLVLVRAAVAKDTAGVRRARAALLALTEPERRRRGRAVALADAWLAGPTALSALAVAEDADDVEEDRPIGPLVVAIARSAGMSRSFRTARVPASELPAQLLHLMRR